jgi:divalent metal cation (Fe/Co/Zn/Cd) transporter
MGAGRTILYILAAVLLFFGVLFIWAAFSDQISQKWGTMAVGVVSLAVALGLIWFAGRLGKKAAQEVTVVQKIDFSGDVQLEKLTCKSCGGALTAENITMLAGAPVVKCPFCGASYQLEEKPKW